MDTCAVCIAISDILRYPTILFFSLLKAFFSSFSLCLGIVIIIVCIGGLDCDAMFFLPYWDFFLTSSGLLGLGLLVLVLAFSFLFFLLCGTDF